MKNRYITSLGVELEGGINESGLQKIKDYINNNNLREFYSSTTDGSVEVRGFDIYNAELRFWHPNISQVLKFVKKCFSAGFTQNDTCGNHIHIRVPENILPLLELPSFYFQFIKEYKIHYANNKKFLDRLSNRYCSASYIGSRVVNQLRRYGSGNRYASINFLSLFEPQATVEFRIFPHCSSIEEYKEMVEWFIETVNKLIKKQFNKRLATKQISAKTIPLTDGYNLQLETITSNETFTDYLTKTINNKKSKVIYSLK